MFATLIQEIFRVYVVNDSSRLMTQEDANCWWNRVANYGSDIQSPPTIPALARMPGICQELAPVLHVHLNFFEEEKVFWRHARELVMKISHANPFPDPCENFPLFVLYLYTFRELLKPATINNCLFYAEHFCPDPPGEFFFGPFLFAVGDPELVIRAFFFMNQQKYPLWVKFLAQTGVIERGFDLFLSFLSSGSLDSNEAAVDLKLQLSVMMTDLITEHEGLVMERKIFESLVKAIRRLIETAPSSVSMTFVRCLTHLGELAISKKLSDVLECVMENSVCFFEKRTIYKSYFLQWLLCRVEHFKATTLLSSLFRQSALDLFTIDVIMKMIPMAKDKPRAVHLSVCFFSRMMIQQTVWARSFGSLLPQLLTMNVCDDLTKKWFRDYLKLSFMCLKMSFSLKRYRRRFLTWVSVIASDEFMGIDWVCEKVHLHARRVLDEKTQFLCSFLNLSSDVRESVSWEKCFEQMKVHRGLLKSLPFRTQSNSLFRVGTKSKHEKVRLSPDIEKLGLVPWLAVHVFINPQQTPLDQLKLGFELEDQRKSLIEKLHEAEASVSRSPIKHAQFWPPQNAELNACNAEVKAIDAKAVEFQREVLSEYSRSCDILIESMKNDKTISVDCPAVVRACEKQRVGSARYLFLKERRTALLAHASSLAKDYANSCCFTKMNFCRNLLEAVSRFNVELDYSPPSLLDDLLLKYIASTQDAGVVDGVCLLIKNKSCETVARTLQDLASRLANAFDPPANPTIKKILFTSITRIVFDKDYTTGASILCQYETENEALRRKYVAFRGTKLTTLGLTDELLAKIMAKPTAFKGARMPEFVGLSFEVNPIDMAYKIYQAVKSYQRIFNDDEPFCEADVVGMLFGGLTVSAPFNLAAVNAFLMLWKDTMIVNPILESAVNAFHKACERMCDDEIVSK